MFNLTYGAEFVVSVIIYMALVLVFSGALLVRDWWKHRKDGGR